MHISVYIYILLYSRLSFVLRFRICSVPLLKGVFRSYCCRLDLLKGVLLRYVNIWQFSPSCTQ